MVSLFWGHRHGHLLDIECQSQVSEEHGFEMALAEAQYKIQLLKLKATLFTCPCLYILVCQH